MNSIIEFLKVLDPDSDRFLIAAYDDKKKGDPYQLYLKPEEIEPQLGLMNKENSYGLFVAVNKFKDGSRTKKDFVKARCIFCEFDGGDVPEWPLAPSIIVNSSPNKYHFYWLTETDNLDEWDAVSQCLVNNYGGDNNAKDISRVLRLPGTYHNKGKPFLVNIEEMSGTHYSWEALKIAFPPTTQKKTSEVVQQPQEAQSKTILEHNKDIINAIHFHGPTLAYLQMLKDGTPGHIVSASLKAMFEMSVAVDSNHEKHSEWQKAYESIDYQIQAYQDKLEIEEIELPKIEEQESYIYELPWPPGDMGDLCREIYEMADHPSQTLAVMTGVALVAGIVGRKFNVSGTGLNVYCALLMDTGRGKSIIGKVINKALLSKGNALASASFLGASNFTGPKGLWDEFKTGYSKVCVMTEAGLMRGQQSGDKKGLERALLDLFTGSGLDMWVGGTKYSNSDNEMVRLNSPALTIIQESTPRSFIEAMKENNSAESGDLPRMWAVRVDGDKPYRNKNPRRNFSNRIDKRIVELIGSAINVQREDILSKDKINHIEIPEFVDAKNDEMVDLENKYKAEGEELKKVMVTRAWVKMIKIAAICDVFNGNTQELTRESFDWSEEVINNEIRGIDDLFSLNKNDDLDAMCKVVAQYIVKILNNGYNDLQKTPAKELRAKGIFLLNNLKQATKGNALIRRLDDDTKRNNPKTGLQKIIDNMCRDGLLIRLNKEQLKMEYIQCRSPSGFKITGDFKTLFL